MRKEQTEIYISIISFFRQGHTVVFRVESTLAAASKQIVIDHNIVVVIFRTGSTMRV